MTKGDKYLRQIEQAAGDAPPLPTAREIYTTTPAPIPPRRNRGYQFSHDGLTVNRDLSDEDWRSILPEIKAMQTAYQLNYGDWMVYGFDRGYQVSYETMAEMTGLNPQTIEVYASVCRNVPKLMRVNSLKFGHYRIVSKLPDDEKMQWIQFAAARNLSTRAMQYLVDLSQLPRLPEGVGPDDDLAALQAGMPDGVTVERVDPTPLPDEIDDGPDDTADIIHEKRVTSFRKKAAQNRYAEIDMEEIIAEQNYLARLRKIVARAKVEADKQARRRGR